MKNEIFVTHNYHCHTKRCGHATGEDEDYVLKAIEGKYQLLGFSDHVFLPGLEQPGIRGSYLLLDNYTSSIRNLAKKYQGKIGICLGFEAEWYGNKFRDYYEKLLKDGVVQYLICGQHCFLDDRDNFVWYGSVFDDEARKERTICYANDLIEAMKSKLYLYIAHPDLFMGWNQKWNDTCEECARKIISAAKELDVILEVNMGPSRWGKKDALGNPLPSYPNGRFWELVSEAGVRSIVGVDAHQPEELIHSPFDWISNFLQERKLKPLKSLPLKGLESK